MPAQPYTAVPTKDNNSTEDISAMTPSSSRGSPTFDDDDEKTVIGSGRADGFEMDDLGKGGRGLRLETSDEALGGHGDEEKLGMHEVDLDERVHYTGTEERAVLKKLDRRVVLFVALLYLLSFLDRSSEFPASLSSMFGVANAVVCRYWKCTHSGSRTRSQPHLGPV
jgi:hypothetical protein